MPLEDYESNDVETAAKLARDHDLGDTPVSPTPPPPSPVRLRRFAERVAALDDAPAEARQAVSLQQLVGEAKYALTGRRD